MRLQTIFKNSNREGDELLIFALHILRAVLFASATKTNAGLTLTSTLTLMSTPWLQCALSDLSVQG